MDDSHFFKVILNLFVAICLSFYYLKFYFRSLNYYFFLKSKGIGEPLKISRPRIPNLHLFLSHPPLQGPPEPLILMLLSTWPRSLRTCSSASLRAMASRWTPSGTSPLSFVFPCTTNTATRCISDRHEFENELHLGRACSSFDIDPATKKKWKKELGQLPKLKLKVPEELLYPQAEYEIRALAEIHERSYDCNILLEVRDVRVPASSHHPSFTRLADHRLHLICYTHADMIDQETRDRVEKWTLKFWKDARCIFLDTRETRANFSARKKVKVWDEDEEDEGEGPKRVTSPYEMVYDSLLKHIEERGGINTALTVGVANTGE